MPSTGPAFALAAQASASQRLVVYAVDNQHRVLPSGSQLRLGQHVTIYALGFAPSAPVQVVDVNRRVIRHVQADTLGTAQVSFRVPAHLAARHAKFVALDGLIGHSAKPGVASSKKTTGQRDPQAVVVSVPLLREFAYRVKSGHGLAGAGAGLGGGLHGGGGNGGLSNTGFDALAFLAAALLLIVLGAVVNRASRRRRSVVDRS